MRKKIVIFGFGSRGKMCGEYVKVCPEEFELVAIIEKKVQRIDIAREMFPDVKIFTDYKEFISLKLSADIVMVATQDQDHKDHAIDMMRAGYDLLLEKPIANTKEDCYAIYQESIKTGRNVVVCHVLRYSPFYSKIKKLIVDGILGDVITINASENVGYFHQAHSFVRGPWRREDESSAMILAKCCHDMDIIRYLMDEKCISVNSYGALNFFKEKNAPQDATTYCSDCPHEDCIYKAQTLYTAEGVKSWFANYFSNRVGNNEGVLQDLYHTQYDKCVFKTDNDVVDHQSTIIQFEKGKTACHTMTAFSRETYRDIKIHGTKAELYGMMEDSFIEVRPYGGEPYKVDCDISEAIVGGHSGSDYFMLKNLYKALNGEKVDGITYLSVSLESHLMCFSAEESRLEKGNTKYIVIDK